MKHDSLLFRLLTVSLLLVCGKEVSANVIIAFTQDGSVADFNVDVGSTIDIPIYLSGDARLASQGLFSAGATLTYAYGSGTGDANNGNASVALAQVDPQWTNTALNFVDVDNSVGNQYAVLEGVVSGPPVTPVKPASGTDYVMLGTVRLSAGAVGNETLLSLSIDRNLAFINLLYNNASGDPLDGELSFVGGRVLTISGVPEPASLGGLALLAAGCVQAVRRRIRLKPSPMN